MYSIFLFLSLCQLPAEAQQVASSLRALGKVQVSFRQETFSDFMDETLAEGTLKIIRPGKMRMTYLKGERKEFICDGVTYYERDDIADSESRVPFEDLEGEPLVRLLLFGDDAVTHFKISVLEHEQGGSFFRLQPHDDQTYYLDIMFDSKWRPSFLEVNNEEGEGTRFFFTDWNTAPKFESDTFKVPPANE